MRTLAKRHLPDNPTIRTVGKFEPIVCRIPPAAELVSERKPIILCQRSAGVRSGTTERWQSGRMRIIANDVTPETGSEGSNPSLSASNQKARPSVYGRAFLFCLPGKRVAGRRSGRGCTGIHKRVFSICRRVLRLRHRLWSDSGIAAVIRVCRSHMSTR